MMSRFATDILTPGSPLMTLNHSPLTSGFMVIHGNKPELLQQLLVDWFKAHPLAPLENETILVQSNGIAQWLKLALAASPDGPTQGGCGIAAAFDMLLPSNFMWRAYRAVLGREAVADVLPFDKPLLVWRLMRLLPTLIDQDGYEPLAAFLQDDSAMRKRYQLADKIADLYDQYQVYRADWLQAWANGEEVLLDLRGQSRDLEPHQRWQSLLWRALLADVGAAQHTSRAAVHQQFLSTIQTLQTRPAQLPRRVSVFGLSSLPIQSLEVLRAISRFTQVLLCVHNPCQHYWADLLSTQDLARRVSGRHARKQGMPEQLLDEDLHLHAHPLLASWGKQGRDYIRFVDEIDAPQEYRPLFEARGHRIDLFEPHVEGEHATLLNQLQEDILQLRSVSETQSTWPVIDPQRDRSLRFHVVHSAQREVEVLHDQLLAAFNADDSLHPRDVLVMVPDVNQYAPHIEAVLGQLPPSDPRHIPFTIADRSDRQQAPVAFALEFLLNLPDSRLTVSEVMDLLDVRAVRQRFGIEADSLPVLRRWIEQAHIRWGLNAQHRRPYMGDQVEQLEQNTWLGGLKRMLLGYAVGTDPTLRTDRDWHGIEPLAEVAGLEAALVGPLSQLLRTLEAWTRTLSESASPSAWGERLRQVLTDFLDCDEPEEAALMLKLHDGLQQWLQACSVAQLEEDLPLGVVRDHWLSQIDQPHLAQRFMGGQLTFATLMPMRAIPFRMVCLLGMSDGEFPRARPPLDFDLMARDLRPGDRSRREDDRFLFLEALLSARERLHISWVGKNIQDNSDRAPSVLVSQLRDHIAAGWSMSQQANTQRLLQALTIEHKLHAFHPDYFGHTPDTSALFTYAHEWECAAPDTGAHVAVASTRLASCAESSPDSLIVRTTLPTPVLDQPLTLRQLAEFLKQPAKTFFRERLHISLDESTDTLADEETFALDALQSWSRQHELIEVRLDALDHQLDEQQAVQRQLDRMQRRGDLPMGAMMSLTQDDLVAPLDRMFKDLEAARSNWPTELHNAVLVHEHEVQGQCLRVEDWITHRRGPPGTTPADTACAWQRIDLSSSNLLQGKHYRLDSLLHPWVVHLAAHASGHVITTVVVGKNGEVTLRPLDVDWARQQFNVLLESYWQGLCHPLPLAAKTGFTWLGLAGDRHQGPVQSCSHNAVEPTRAVYERDYHREGEVQRSPYLQRAYPTFNDLWSNGEFTRWCHTLYAPLRDSVGVSRDGT